MNRYEQTVPTEEEKVQELKALMLKNIDSNTITKIYDYYTQLLQSHPDSDLRKVRLFHTLIGSTPVESYIERFDLPGGEIERFIREMM